jgi:hypothetical protein
MGVTVTAIIPVMNEVSGSRDIEAA